MPTDPATIAYRALPAKLGTGCMIPVYYYRVDGACLTIEAYLPHDCTAAQQQRCRDNARQRGIASVEIVLVMDIPPDKLWAGHAWGRADDAS